MNKATKAALAGAACVVLGPVGGLLVVAIYFLRKQSGQQAQRLPSTPTRQPSDLSPNPYSDQ